MNSEELPYLNLSLEDIEGEEWLDIPNYDGIYHVSNLGRVKSLKREYYRVNDSSPRYTKEIILKQTKVKPKVANAEVLYVSLKVNGVRKTYTVNQLVGIAFIGEAKKGYHFHHKNKNSLDNRLENIEQVTLKKSKSTDHKLGKREAHNSNKLHKSTAKYKIIRSDGKEFRYSDIVELYGRSAYLNIMKGYSVRGYKWKVRPLI